MIFSYQHKLKSDLRIQTIMDALSDDCKYLEAKRVENSLKNFMASADTAVTIQHVSEVNREEVETSEDENHKVSAIHQRVDYLNSKKYKQVG